MSRARPVVWGLVGSVTTLGVLLIVSALPATLRKSFNREVVEFKIPLGVKVLDVTQFVEGKSCQIAPGICIIAVGGFISFFINELYGDSVPKNDLFIGLLDDFDNLSR